MNPYGFDNPVQLPPNIQRIVETAQYLDQIKQASEQNNRALSSFAQDIPVETTPVRQTQQSPQASGTDMVNAAIESTMPKAPSPTQVQFQRGLLGLKNLYGSTDNPDEQAIINRQADNLRSVANAAGIDLSGYGSDVNLEDATRNLMTQEARDVISGLQGAYSKTSEQHYNDRYHDLIANGYSPRQARKFAGDMAREYQADRVSYLNNLYNSYGREGLVTTPEGNQMLAALAFENPSLANFYAQIYPNAKDTYLRQTQLEDIGLNQALAENNAGLNYYYNQLGADNQLKRQMYSQQQNYEHQKDLRNDEYNWRDRHSDIDFNHDVLLANLNAKNQRELFELQQKYNGSNVEGLYSEGVKLAEKYGIVDDKEIQKVAIAYVEKNLKLGNNNYKPKIKLTPKQQDFYNRVGNAVNEACLNLNEENLEKVENLLNPEKNFDDTLSTFPNDYYNRLNDTYYGLKSVYALREKDKDEADAYYSKMKDPFVILELFPNDKEELDEYYEFWDEDLQRYYYFFPETRPDEESSNNNDK